MITVNHNIHISFWVESKRSYQIIDVLILVSMNTCPKVVSVCVVHILTYLILSPLGNHICEECTEMYGPCTAAA